MEFLERVRHIISCIPPGRVATYGQIAQLAGSPKRARHVAVVLRGGGLPWHRVLGAGGHIRTKNVNEQASRLREEGVEVKRERVDLSRYAWQVSPLAFIDGV